MRFASVCSGIEAASVAWEPMGWSPAWLSEIEPFPNAVLSHRFPLVPNHGDFTVIANDPTHAAHGDRVELLVGGTPCQAFSVAGLRGGYTDPRGRLTLEFLRLARVLRPRWLVWENVDGVRSSGGGRDFGAFLAGLGQIGYGWAYRVLDAQYVRVDGYPRAVPQRRKRVFVVGHLGGGWQRAAAVLFEPEGVRRDPPTRRASRKGAAADAATGSTFWNDADVAETLTRTSDDPRMPDKNNATQSDVAGPIDAHHYKGPGSRQGGEREYVAQAMALPVAPSLTASNDPSRSPQSSEVTQQVAAVYAASMAVRRLTPRECERLMGFPDDWTLVPWKEKSAEECPDGGRYKALGNSIAVNCLRWVGRRIELVDKTWGVP